jgi:hypothetical protein
VATIKDGYWIDNWIYWITHSYTQLQCIHSYSSLQFTTTLAESSHCIFTGCLSSNIAGSFHLQLCNSSLKTAAWPEYSLVTANLRLLWLAGALGYIARERTPKKTLSPILHCCMTSSPERTPRKTPTVALAAVACLSVAIATVVNTCFIAYSMHVTIYSI